MNAPPPAVIDPWGAPSAAGGGAADNMATMDNTNLILWRQRSVRTLMMFLLMLLLMDGEEGNGNNSQHNRNRDRLRKRKFQKSSTSLVAVQPLERDVFDARQKQEATLRSLVQGHPRYHHLVAKNGGSNVEQQVLQWTERLDAMVKDQFGQEEEQRGSVLAASPTSLAEEMVLENENNINNNNNDPSSEILAMDATTKVFHYPWNATGFYRGQWKRHHRNSKKDKTATTTKSPRENEADYYNNNNNNTAPLPATALEESLLQTLHQRREIAGVYLLPRGQEIALRNDNNLTTLQYERMTLDATGKVYPPPAAAAMPGSVLERHPPTATSSSSATTAASDSSSRSRSTITLTMDSGRAAFQFYSRSIPGMRELSLVDGFVKLYDSSSPGYSTRQDVLLRVRGVLIHAIGRLSLVSSAAASGGGGGASSQRSALVMGNGLQLVNDEKATSGASGEEGTKTKTGSITAATTRHRRRRLQEALSNIKQYHNDDNEAENMKVQMDAIRRHAMALYGTPEDSAHDELFSSTKTSGAGFAIQSPELLLHQRRLDVVEEEEEVDAVSLVDATEPEQTGEEEEDAQSSTTAYASAAVAQHRRVAETDPKEDHTNNNKKKKKKNHLIPPWSDVVIPYPFVRDDADETIRKVRTPAARRMPVREQMLESNAGSCEFEINLNVQELEWTVGAWRKLLTHKLVETKKLNPYVNSNNNNNNNNKEDSSGGGVGGTRPDSEVANEVHLVGVSSTDSMPGAPSRSKKFVPDQALVMKLVGTIESRNCDFSATLNATALRTDWDATTNKAINYSFYMMLVCLTQIIILLRQLLHSQAQSAATRVSIVCIGWQTVVDALICLGHIYLSLAMQPLFTAFASVAFFKLLIFCVIEMKYMAIIIQARNSANGGQPTEVLRRQAAVLHLRIYVALFGTFILLFYVGDTHRTIAMVTLYSFWVPQIILNVVTEARTPMHKYYIYGMSFTRMIAPLYVFCIRNNFLKEVYPDAPHDPDMCLVLVLWMALQTAVLMAQSKYGARFMIPARFLPPKFDYSRPLPVSMLPPGTTAASMAEMHSSDPSDERSSSLSPPHDRSRHTTADTTRKRTKKGNRGKTSSHFEDGETAEMNSGIDNNGRGPASPISASSSRLPRAPAPTLDCSICYEAINIRDRQGYMLAPCEHLYHRDCLVRWMDIKMECPTCRTELPAL
jgi:Ring finger domain